MFSAVQEMLSGPIVGTIDRMNVCDVSWGKLFFERFLVIPDVIE